MITGESKNKVDKLWEMFWTGGLINLLNVKNVSTERYFNSPHHCGGPPPSQAKEA